MGMDIATRTYAHSWRQLTAELGIPLQQVRTALKQLEKDGLIATQQVTQRVTYGLTQKVTHKVTQIYIMSASDLDEATNEATNSPTNSQTNSQTNTQGNSDINNKNIPINGKLSHSDARARLPKIRDWLLGSLGLEAPEADELTKAFLDRQELKGKTWDNEGDLLAHAISWAEKRMKPRKAPKMSDTQARQMEYQRAAEVAAQETDQEKELRLVKYAWADYCAKARKDGEDKAGREKNNYLIKRQAYEEKFGKISAK